MDGVPTLNQWVLLAEPGQAPSVCTIECSKILVGSTSEDIAAHIAESWANGVKSTGETYTYYLLSHICVQHASF
jgi:hypothetical protein